MRHLRYCLLATPLGLLLLAGGGCTTLQPGETRRMQAIAEAARPILTLDPNACWTDSYNRLLEFGPDALAYLMAQPALTRRAAPDDLSLLMHLSLVRMLAAPGSPPRLSVRALETTLGILHFDPKVNGERLGTAVLADALPPRAWPDLYPADFDQALAAQVDLEADRRALQAWWAGHRDQAESLLLARPLVPRTAELWRILARRPADRWQYLPQSGPVRCEAGAADAVALCVDPPRGPALLDIPTRDYNLVRAACIWLGTQRDADVEARLIELVGSPDPTLAHNALFALHFSPNERVRALLKRHDAVNAAPPAEPALPPPASL